MSDLRVAIVVEGPADSMGRTPFLAFFWMRGAIGGQCFRSRLHEHASRRGAAIVDSAFEAYKALIESTGVSAKQAKEWAEFLVSTHGPPSEKSVTRLAARVGLLIERRLSKWCVVRARGGEAICADDNIRFVDGYLMERLWELYAKETARTLPPIASAK